MKLGDYVQGLPRGERTAFRARLAKAHERSIALIRKWEAWPPPEDWSDEQIKKRARKHPAELAAVKITEEITENAVLRSDLRPECWGEG